MNNQKLSYDSKIARNRNITDAEAKEMKYCPVCNHEKGIGMAVCWDCFKNQPKCSSVVMPGYKHYGGTLADFIAEANIPF